MRVPSLAPLLSVLVDRVEEEVVEQPDMLGPLGFETVAVFEVEEEDLPFPSEPFRDIIP